MKNFIYIENPEINHNFDEEIDHLTGKQSAMVSTDIEIEAIKQITREEGIEKGRKEGMKKGSLLL